MSSDIRGEARLAVLIDAENIAAGRAEPLFKAVAKLGRATAKRIYGDWTRPDMAQWRGVLNEHAIVPIQQFRMAKGKNCVDCALIVDAMDLLYTGRFDGFCIVSSDSDFTRLAHRLRESGLIVYGFGAKTTPGGFVKACDRFIMLEPPEPAPAPQPAPRPELDEEQRALVEAAYLAAATEDGWADLASLGSRIRTLSPSFDPRAFGHGKLGGLVESLGLFEVAKTPSSLNPASFVWRIKLIERRVREEGEDGASESAT